MSSGSDIVAEIIRREAREVVNRAKLPRLLGQRVSVLFDLDDSGYRRFPTPFGRLTVYAYEAAGGSGLKLSGPAAMAIECLTAAAVVLDDLQDQEATPGLHLEEPGAGAELVAVLLVLAQGVLATLADMAVIPSRALAVYDAFSEFELHALRGQHESNMQSSRSSVTLGDAKTAAGAKSGSFGRIAGRVGALLATSDAGRISECEGFGWHFGVIDQLQNDVAGVWPGGDSDPDLRLGRKTVPITFALEVPSRADATLGEVSPDPHASADTEELSIRRALFESGAIHYTMISAGVHLARARRIASRIRLGNPRSRLEELLTP